MTLYNKGNYHIPINDYPSLTNSKDPSLNAKNDIQISRPETNQIIQPRKTIIVNQNMGTGTNFIVKPYLSFTPKFCIVRQLIYANTNSSTDSGTFLIWSSLANDYIGACYVGIQSVGLMPETMLLITSPVEQIQFNVTSANTANFTGPTGGQLTMVLEFF